MNDTASATKTEAPKVAPAAQPIATINRKEAWETFQEDLTKRADEIGSQLPPNLSRDRFLGASLAAVKSTPGILLATPRSLMAALTKAAQDGLLPDGREGIITVYSTTVDGQKQNVAQWNPMFYGIRKRARELDGIIIDAQVVFAGDDFDYELGDAPFIKHKPKPRTETVDASAGVAVYAIFRHPEQGILHREVMWKPEVFATMNQSRAKGSLMWTVFWTEGWRKACGRRGSKSVPVSPQLERLIQRDDENFSFDNPTPSLPRPSIDNLPEVPKPDPSTTSRTDQPSTRGETGDLASGVAQSSASNDDEKRDTIISGTSTEVAKDVVTAPDMEAYFARIEEEIGGIEDEDEFTIHWQALGIEAALVGNEPALDRAEEIRRKHLTRIEKAGRTALEAAGQTTMFDDLPEPPK